MVDDEEKKNGITESFENIVPDLPKKVDTEEFHTSEFLNLDCWSKEISGSNSFFNDYKINEEIDHLDGQTIEEAEHQLATRLYQNNARVHFNHHIEKDGRFGKKNNLWWVYNFFSKSY